MPAAARQPTTRPDWEALLDLAVSQAGYFATAQAADLGFSPELLVHHRERGRIERTRRGIYRERHLPAQVEMTVPAAWQRRRLRVPAVLRLHDAELSEQERGWVGHVPVTTPARTLRDCMAASVVPDLVRQAVEEGIAPGALR